MPLRVRRVFRLTECGMRYAGHAGTRYIYAGHPRILPPALTPQKHAQSHERTGQKIYRYCGTGPKILKCVYPIIHLCLSMLIPAVAMLGWRRGAMFAVARLQRVGE